MMCMWQCSLKYVRDENPVLKSLYIQYLLGDFIFYYTVLNSIPVLYILHASVGTISVNCQLLRVYTLKLKSTLVYYRITDGVGGMMRKWSGISRVNQKMQDKTETQRNQTAGESIKWIYLCLPAKLMAAQLCCASAVWAVLGGWTLFMDMVHSLATHCWHTRL